MFFFFKQKTANEMRISDWSSDVCSSDLCADCLVIAFQPVASRHALEQQIVGPADNHDEGHLRWLHLFDLIAKEQKNTGTERSHQGEQATNIFQCHGQTFRDKMMPRAVNKRTRVRSPMASLRPKTIAREGSHVFGKLWRGSRSRRG